MEGDHENAEKVEDWSIIHSIEATFKAGKEEEIPCKPTGAEAQTELHFFLGNILFVELNRHGFSKQLAYQPDVV